MYLYYVSLPTIKLVLKLTSLPSVFYQSLQLLTPYPTAGFPGQTGGEIMNESHFSLASAHRNLDSDMYVCMMLRFVFSPNVVAVTDAGNGSSWKLRDTFQRINE